MGASNFCFVFDLHASVSARYIEMSVSSCISAMYFNLTWRVFNDIYFVLMEISPSNFRSFI